MKRLLLPLLILPISLFAEGGLPDKPYIYVQGKAEIQKPADVVTLKFDLVSRNPDESKANQDVQGKANKVLALLDSRKIAVTDVIAGDLRSEPEYEETDSSTTKHGKLIGYSVTRSFSVRVRDVAAFAKLVDELLTIGGTEFSGIEGGLSKEKEMQDEVWEKTLTDARERAEKTLKTMGMKIDSVFAVSPVTFPEISRNIFRGPGAFAEEVGRAPTKLEISQYRLAPVTVSQSVHVIYLISPAK
jgi:uncharacterized protein YggE